MTTIAYDGKTLCVDSMTNCGHITSRTHQKLFTDVGEFAAVAICGATACYPPIINWLTNGADPAGWNSSWEAAAWCLKPDGELLRYVAGYPEVIDAPDADGSGAEYALGAMLAGATAREAMDIAVCLDLYTGGVIRAFDVQAARKAA